MKPDSDRLKQIRRQWNGYVKYRVPRDPEVAELHQAVGDLLDEIDEIQAEIADCGHDPFELAQIEDLEDEVTDLKAEISKLEDAFDEELVEKLAGFAPAFEELHRQAHGPGSLYLCPNEPCSGLYRLLPNERGRVLA